jgi:hypothetical protein
MTSSIIGQNWDHLMPYYYFRSDSSFNYDYEKHNDRNEINVQYYDEYDQLLERIRWTYNDSLQRIEPVSRSEYRREIPNERISLNSNYDPVTNQWKLSKKTITEYYENSRETRNRLTYSYKLETNSWELIRDFEKIYHHGQNTYEEITREYEKQNGTLKKIASRQVEMDEFKNPKKTINRQKKTEDDDWLNERMRVRDVFSDSVIIQQYRWDTLINNWSSPHHIEKLYYYNKSEHGGLIPSTCTDRRAEKSKIIYSKNRRTKKLYPVSKSEYRHYVEEDPMRRETIEYKWDKEGKKWNEPGKYDSFYDRIDGKNRGYIRYKKDSESEEWIPENRNMTNPDRKGYLRSKRQDYDKEKGQWKKGTMYQFRPCYPVKIPERA